MVLHLYFDPKEGCLKQQMKTLLPIRGNFNELQRGMELSDVVAWNNRYYTFDDRTGIVFELLPFVNKPSVLQSETNSKGFKIEWASVKDNMLYIGSIGKEYVSPDGVTVLHEDLFGVIRLNDNKLEPVREDWKRRYQALRAISGCPYPGYLIHEAARFSNVRREWVFLPRRCSTKPYDEVSDEIRGCNLILGISEANTIWKRKIRKRSRNQRKGYSAFAFMPGTNDEVLVALSTEENSSTA
uniref:Soluble calcium-activated nucleotidase 1-like n=1 Tax=Dermatophagoides pteronyssinus TaxID=6956 RepID=A0A6P6Y4Q4_DERPT